MNKNHRIQNYKSVNSKYITRKKKEMLMLTSISGGGFI